ncbi:putative integral membrane protein [Handroanthus impetiginosus]|uniref:WAT1-related protein n=1 Tax=Handroanthus impetiginosus TaxID=429701 RepID=A0A2G9GVM8_9LAMI|nr:putative integral membrane protein [Handroanthus impetiginosus]
MGIQKQMPLIAMIFTQFIHAAMYLLNKAAISSGMKPSVFVVYRQAIAALVLAPFAYFCERKKSPLKFNLLFKIYVVSSFGIAMTLNLQYASLNYVTATFVTAINNTIPSVVFLIAVSLRIEKLAVIQRHGLAKVLGSMLGLSGAMIYTFYKGPPLYSGSENETHMSLAKTITKEDWIKGSLLLMASILTWSSWLIIQNPLLKEYPTRLRLTTMQCGFSCITATIYSAAVERNISSWLIGWNVNLVSVVYSGILVTGISYSLQVWVVQKRGPVFTSIFSPLALLLTAIFSAIIFHETVHWGSILGGAFLVGGLYAFLWGKNKEVQSIVAPQQQQEFNVSKEEAHLECIVTTNSPNHEQDKI